MMRLTGFGVAIAIVAIGFLLWRFVFDDKGTDKPEKQIADIDTTGQLQVGQRFKKASQCTKDDECPDQQFCNERGLCVNVNLIPSVPSITDGRGRAAEGTDVRVTLSNQTQT